MNERVSVYKNKNQTERKVNGLPGATVAAGKCVSRESLLRRSGSERQWQAVASKVNDDDSAITNNNNMYQLHGQNEYE